MTDINLNPEDAECFPVLGHRHGKRPVWRLTCVLKQQIRHTGEDKSCGLRGVRQLNLLGGETHTQGVYLDGWVIHKVGNKKRKFARRVRRRTRLERLRKRRTRHVSRAWSTFRTTHVRYLNSQSLQSVYIDSQAVKHS